MKRDKALWGGCLVSFYVFMPGVSGYTGAVKPPVRRTGNRKSGPEETGIYAAEPPSRRNSFPGWGRQLIGYIIRSVPDPVRIPLLFLLA